MIKLVRITTVPVSLRLLITGQPAYMKREGFDVSLVSSEGEDWQHIEGLTDLHVHKVDMARQIDIIKDIKSLFSLIRLFRKIKPDIVHSHTPKAGLLAMMAARFCRVPVRVHTLAGMPLMTAVGIKRKVLYQMEKLTFACSHETWPNSKQLMKYILQHNMIRKNKAVMILNGSSNGIDLSKFSKESLNADRLQQLKKLYHITADDFCFLAVGRMVKDKGLLELVKAFLIFRKKVTNARLFLLGPFESADGLPEELVQTIKTHQAITHIDWSNEVEYFMALSRCFIHASHREGFPNVVLQAGAIGVPIICSDISGNIDIVENVEEGYLYPVKDAAALQQNMEAVYSDYETALKKVTVLQSKVIQNYDRRAVHNAIKERYLKLVKNRKADVSESH